MNKKGGIRMTITYIKCAAQVITVKGGSQPRRAEEMSDLGIIGNGSVLVKNGRIVFVGPDVKAQEYLEHIHEPINIIDAEGKIVTPGLIDPHTHLVFGGSREKELEMRLNGAKYIDILKAGGGILQTTVSTRQATEEELIKQSTKRLNKFLQYGVTTVEAKSGYGLNLKDEIKQLKVAKKLNEQHPVHVVSTFMGAHAVPVEYKGNEDEFVRFVIEEMIPIVAKEELAELYYEFCLFNDEDDASRSFNGLYDQRGSCHLQRESNRKY